MNSFSLMIGNTLKKIVLLLWFFIKRKELMRLRDTKLLMKFIVMDAFQQWETHRRNRGNINSFF